MERRWDGKFRHCWNCQTWKPTTDFYQGKQYRCIACYRAYYIENRERILETKRVWYLSHIDERAAYARKYRARKKAEQINPRWRALP